MSGWGGSVHPHIVHADPADVDAAPGVALGGDGFQNGDHVARALGANDLIGGAGAGTSYQIVGSKSAGDVVTILETVTAEGYTWGRIDIGWICMNYVRMN